MNTKSTICIIDDNDQVIQSLQWLTESVGYNVKTYNHAQAFLDANNYDNANCLIIDVRMPNMSGLELQEILQQQQCHIPIIFITGHGDIPMAVRAMKNGAVDFLTKPVNNQLLIETINRCVNHDLDRRDQNQQRELISAKIKLLTKRERDVVKYVIFGASTRMIAEKLGISPNTVELHRSRIMRKMGTKSTTKLISLILTNNITIN